VLVTIEYAVAAVASLRQQQLLASPRAIELEPEPSAVSFI